jgi:hypothetical protein
MLIYGNNFVEQGNTSHTTTFINFNNAAATARVFGNYAPSSMTAVNPGSATVTPGIFTPTDVEFPVRTITSGKSVSAMPHFTVLHDGSAVFALSR